MTDNDRKLRTRLTSAYSTALDGHRTAIDNLPQATKLAIARKILAIIKEDEADLELVALVQLADLAIGSLSSEDLAVLADDREHATDRYIDLPLHSAITVLEAYRARLPDRSASKGEQDLARFDGANAAVLACVAADPLGRGTVNSLRYAIAELCLLGVVRAISLEDERNQAVVARIGKLLDDHTPA